MKRFEDKDRPAPGGSRTGPRARAAEDRKFGDVRSRSRDSSRADPYQRADRPPRPDAARSAPYGERLRAPAAATIQLDADVARVFRDSEAVNEALRMVIRLARSVSSGTRPAFNRSGAPSGPRVGAPVGQRPRVPSERYSRSAKPKDRRPASPVRREPKFEEPD
ncbi:MAG: hypothetical protein ABJA83_14425 [Burkholderiaceae bacterium]